MTVDNHPSVESRTTCRTDFTATNALLATDFECLSGNDKLAVNSMIAT
jgi:hypothetical protein